MKFIKRLTALLLSAACVCALVCVPPAGAASTVSTFPDVTDPQVGRAVEALRTMGVIDGSGGYFEPNGSLTRAQFCKMSILVMGKGDEAAAQASRTIFNDVPGKHWARGYVNLAALTTVGGEEGKGGSRLMMGLGNGSFAPDRAITYGEAVTAVLRILGYTKEANFNWPYGAVAAAAAVGLDSGFTPPGANDPITRAQAALLFCNMLTAPLADSKEPYATKYLGEQKKNLVLVSCNEKTENGQDAVKFFSNEDAKQTPIPYAVNAPATFLQGSRGTAIVKDEKLVTFIPDLGTGSKTITISSASAGSICVITTTDGAKITLAPDTKVWNSKDDKPDEYRNTFKKLDRPGMIVTVCYTAAGAVDYLYVDSFIADSAKNGVMVAKNPISGNPFAQLTAGTTDYSIVKNGVPATMSDIRRYDVATFDSNAKVLYVSDFRLNCTYLGASPNTAAPSKIQVSVNFGESYKDGLPVLNCAIDDLKQFKFGENFTLLFSADGKVAGAVKSSEARSNAVGYVDGSKLVLVNAPEDLSEISTAGELLDNYQDCLVNVNGTKTGISLSRLSGRTPPGPLNLKNNTLGDTPLAGNVAVFEKVGTSAIKKISLSDVTVSSVPASKIAYQRTNAYGKVDLLILNDVTGDLYTYGICKNVVVDPSGNAYVPSDNPETTPPEYTNNTTTVSNSKSNGKPSATVVGGTTYKNGQFIGVVESLNVLDKTSLHRHAASVALKSITKVSPSNFNLSTGLFFSGSTELPISDDVQCYNAQTKKWFGEDDATKKPSMEYLRACLAYSSNLTVWYDRDPAQGGKVRVVVAN